MRTYSLTPADKDRYLHFTVHGDNTPETIRRYVREVYAAAEARSCRIILLEEHLEGPSLPLADAFQIIADAVGSLQLASYRVAFVNMNPDHPWSNVKFAETVARNRGLEMCAFSSLAEATAWILRISETRRSTPD